MKEIVVASSNEHKIKEISQILEPLNIKVIGMNEILNESLDIEETGTTFMENACIKAKAVSDIINRPVFADDSGLEVEALNNQPGIYSARFMGEDTSYAIKNQYIIDQLKDKQNRKARFVCALCLVLPNQDPIHIEEYFDGEIAHKIEGENGFGYDPIFYFPPLEMTASQMDSATKNIHSHRGKALAKLFEKLKELS